MLPARRMKRRPTKTIPARDLWQLRLIQLANGADQRARFDQLLRAIGLAHANAPERAVLLPRRREHLRLEADQLAQLEALGALAEISEQRGLGGIVIRPVGLLRERVREERVRHVDAAARVGVLVPRPPHFVVLLEHYAGHAGLREPMCRQQPRHAGANNHHAEIAARRERLRVPVRRAQIVVADREFLLHEREVWLDLRLRRNPAQDPAQEIVARHGRRGAAGVAVLREHRERVRARLLCRRFATLEAARVADHRRGIRAQVGAQNREIAGDVRERGQQRGQVRLRERARDLVVRFRDALRRAREIHRVLRVRERHCTVGARAALGAGAARRIAHLLSAA